MNADSPIILAIDTTDTGKAKSLIEATRPFIGIYKFGLEFYLRHGLSALKEIKREMDLRIFLDLKLHDIPNTVGKAAAAVAEVEPFILTVHASGGEEMIEAAAKSLPQTMIAAVTVLTSLDQDSLDSMGIDSPLTDLALNLARTALNGGARALVASPHEVVRLKGALPTMRIITPGIRIESGSDDQRRVMTPKDAIDSGSDYLVIGRPITAAPSPAEAAESILRSLV